MKAIVCSLAASDIRHTQLKKMITINAKLMQRSVGGAGLQRFLWL